MFSIRFLLATAVIGCAPFAAADDLPGARYLKAASRAGTPALQKKAYAELAKLHRAKIGGVCYFDRFPSLDLGGRPAPDVRPPDDAAANLFSMGIDVLPVLAEALDDTTSTKTPHYDFDPRRNGLTPIDRNFQVNEVVAMLICAIAHREFWLGKTDWSGSIRDVGPKPELAPKFEGDVLNWYAENKGKTMSERMINQLSDWSHVNRFNAIVWLGGKKEKAGRDALLEHVRRVSNPPLGDSRYKHGSDSELAECACALGQIGDQWDLGTVRRICKYFSGEVAMSGVRERAFYSDDVFTAYRGLAYLGKKEEAVKELQRLYDEFVKMMSPASAGDFLSELERAKKWGQEARGRPGEPTTGEKKVTPTKPGESAGK